MRLWLLVKNVLIILSHLINCSAHAGEPMGSPGSKNSENTLQLKWGQQEGET